MASVTGSFSTAAIQTPGVFALDSGSLAQMLTDNGTAQAFSLGLSSISADVSDTVRLTGWSGTVPAGATIDGISVSIKKSKTGTDTVTDATVQLCKSGAAVGDNYADATDYPTSYATTTYGGSSDLWNASWSSTDFDASFGVHIAGNCGDYNPPYPIPLAPSLPYWDYVSATVYYTPASGGGGGGTGEPKRYHFDGGTSYCNPLIAGAAEGNVFRPYLGLPTEFQGIEGPFTEYRKEDE